MNDTFAEQLVKKLPDSSDTVKKALLIVGSGIILILLIILCFYSFLIILPTGLVGFAAYRLITGLNVEYEYTVTNGSVDIDKIIAQRKRVSLISADVKDFTAFGPVSSADDFNGTEIHAIGGDDEIYYANFNNESYGEVRLLFSPNEKILACIKPYLKGNLRH